MSLSPPSIEELVGRARTLVPRLRERAAEAEALRRLPEATLRDFVDAGFFRVLQPRRYGGYELDYGTHMRLAIEAGRGCASSAWVLSVIASHPWILGMFPSAAQEEVWGKDEGALIATSFLPIAPKVEPAEGGIMLSGRWKFSSGVDLCQWSMVMVGLPPLAGKGPLDLHLALIPLAEARIEDSWRAAGLCGTGSNDIVAERIFVPQHRFLAIATLRGGPTPGSTVNPNPIYTLPLWATLPFTLIGAALGAARGALELVADGLSGRRSVANVALAEQQSAQHRIARAAVRLDAAEALLLGVVDRINRTARDGSGFPMLERVRYRADCSYGAELCIEAVDTLFPLLGGRGLLAADPVQRAWRDIHAAAQHIALVWDVNAGLYGSVRLGLPCPDPKI
jgi:3-hydroxy-9,10-secoandrosta-1,3,5(10)-triene-9,17-dione monooxygenase